MTSLILTLCFLQHISIIDSPTQYTIDRYLENAVYYEQTMMWITPKNDPYTLVNFQNAYHNLLTGNTLQELTPSQLTEFKKEQKLMPTHYLLKFYPKNLDQLYRLTDLEGIYHTPVPINYIPLRADDVEKVEELFGANKPYFFEKPMYKVLYNDLDKSDTTTYNMPIMYVVWPVGKKKPRRIKCKKCYDVFIPDYQKHTRSLSLSREALEILELEATAIATKNDEMNIFLYHD